MAIFTHAEAFGEDPAALAEDARDPIWATGEGRLTASSSQPADRRPRCLVPNSDSERLQAGYPGHRSGGRQCPLLGALSYGTCTNGTGKEPTSASMSPWHQELVLAFRDLGKWLKQFG